MTDNHYFCNHDEGFCYDNEPTMFGVPVNLDRDFPQESKPMSPAALGTIIFLIFWLVMFALVFGIPAILDHESAATFCNGVPC